MPSQVLLKAARRCASDVAPLSGEEKRAARQDGKTVLYAVAIRDLQRLAIRVQTTATLSASKSVQAACCGSRAGACSQSQSCVLLP